MAQRDIRRGPHVVDWCGLLDGGWGFALAVFFVLLICSTLSKRHEMKAVLCHRSWRGNLICDYYFILVDLGKEELPGYPSTIRLFMSWLKSLLSTSTPREIRFVTRSSFRLLQASSPSSPLSFSSYTKAQQMATGPKAKPDEEWRAILNPEQVRQCLDICLTTLLTT